MKARLAIESPRYRSLRYVHRGIRLRAPKHGRPKTCPTLSAKRAACRSSSSTTTFYRRRCGLPTSTRTPPHIVIAEAALDPPPVRNRPQTSKRARRRRKASGRSRNMTKSRNPMPISLTRSTQWPRPRMTPNRRRLHLRNAHLRRSPLR